MAPKVLIVVGVLMAALLFISSEVTARELAETTANEEQTNMHAEVAVEDQSRGRCFRNCRCCYWIFNGCCGRCCNHKNEAPEMETEAKPHN